VSRTGAGLSGAWSGAYRYPADIAPETVFEARIEERDGALQGTTQEPDILNGGGVVTADIEGMRHGDAVSFVKYMDGSGGMSHAIQYEGRVNGDFTRIEGVWSIPGDWSGTFFMQREDAGAEEALERAARVRF
jgi:hypothetical protein